MFFTILTFHTQVTVFTIQKFRAQAMLFTFLTFHTHTTLFTIQNFQAPAMLFTILNFRTQVTVFTIQKFRAQAMLFTILNFKHTDHVICNSELPSTGHLTFRVNTTVGDQLIGLIVHVLYLVPGRFHAECHLSINL